LSPLVVVFDLGGVVLDLAGLHAFLRRHRLDLGDFFARALGSGAHHRFERGDLEPGDYAAQFLAESGLDLDVDAFLAEFADWPGGLLPGAEALVAETRAVVPVATLSNTNPIHWETPLSITTVRPMFDRHFPSYQLGLAKPDPALFARVVAELGVPADRVLFFDDNERNVESAAAVGLVARTVDGPAAAREVLVELGVLSGR